MTPRRDFLDIVCHGVGPHPRDLHLLYKTQLRGSLRKKRPITAEGPLQTVAGGINKTRPTTSSPQLSFS